MRKDYVWVKTAKISMNLIGNAITVLIGILSHLNQDYAKPKTASYLITPIVLLA